jgi:hypothetical protein
MSERPQPDLDEVRNAMRAHDERSAEEAQADRRDDDEPEEPEADADAPSSTR